MKLDLLLLRAVMARKICSVHLFRIQWRESDLNTMGSSQDRTKREQAKRTEKVKLRGRGGVRELGLKIQLRLTYRTCEPSQ